MVFKDASSGHLIVSRSTMTSEQTIKLDDGKDTLSCSNHAASHPFYTGTQRSSIRRSVDKFKKRYNRYSTSLKNREGSGSWRFFCASRVFCASSVFRCVTRFFCASGLVTQAVLCVTRIAGPDQSNGLVALVALAFDCSPAPDVSRLPQPEKVRARCFNPQRIMPSPMSQAAMPPTTTSLT